MRNRLIVVAVVAAFAAIAVPTAPTTASAAPSTSKCDAKYGRALENTSLRVKPTTKSTRLGTVLKGDRVKCILGYRGGTYTACGVANVDFWTKVRHKGRTGYVADACMTVD